MYRDGRFGRGERSGSVPDLADEDLACGRRENHGGPCRSAQAMARYRRADRERWHDRGSATRQARRAAA
jgi:hypothetical protein